MEEKLLKEISEIESSRGLRALWEAGLTSPLQEAVLKQLEKIS